MTDTEITEPDATKSSRLTTLSTGVDDDLYAWFRAQAEANYRNISGHLRWLIEQHRRQIDAEPMLNEGFASALRKHLGVPSRQRPRGIPGEPYVAEPDPDVTVRWSGEQLNAWAVPPGPVAGPPFRAEVPIEDDPEEGVL